MSARWTAVASCLALAVCAQAGETPPRPDTARSAAMATETWDTLFDGRDLSRWRGYRRQDVPAGWQAREGAIAFVPGGGESAGGDLITRDRFGDFELELEWKVEAGGNSGIFYRATEETERIYENAGEMQVLDNRGHRDGQSPLTSAGANYGLYAPGSDVARPAGEWNRVRIVARGSHVEHWLNGTKILEFEQGGDDWKRRVAGSKFTEWPSYGRSLEGHIGLQDHGDPVWYRSIRVRRLGPS